MNARSRALVALGVAVATALGLPGAARATTVGTARPISLSFPTPRVGYVLSLADCATRTCVTLAHTSDGGTTWAKVPTPTGLRHDVGQATWGFYGGADGYATLSVHFADARDGWIYGVVPARATPTNPAPNYVYRLWSTHTAGATWTAIPLGPVHLRLGVVAMATHGAWTYLYGASASPPQSLILATASTQDRWGSRARMVLPIPAGGTQLQGAITFAGRQGWFVGGNDRGAWFARLGAHGTWVPWTVTSLAVRSAGFRPVAVTPAGSLLVVAASSGFSTPTSSVPPGWNAGSTWMVISQDGGRTFVPRRELSASYHVVFPVVPGLPAAPASGVLLVERQTSSGALQLVRSANGGATWQVVVRHDLRQVSLGTRGPGFAIAVIGPPTSVDAVLLRTLDAGGHWAPVTLHR